MKQWLRVLIYALEIAIILAVIYHEPSYQLRGMLRNEAFFDGKPTSWWREELKLWDVEVREPSPPSIEREARFSSYRYSRRGSGWERMREHLRIRPKSLKEEKDAVVLEILRMLGKGPSVIQDIDAEPVLRQLLDDPSPKIRRFARIGLKMPLEED